MYAILHKVAKEEKNFQHTYHQGFIIVKDAFIDVTIDEITFVSV